ncbi:IS1 family transposase [Escherichia coli]
MASVSISCPSCSADGVVRRSDNTTGHHRCHCCPYRRTRRQLQLIHTVSPRGTHENNSYGAERGGVRGNELGAWASARF